MPGGARSYQNCIKALAFPTSGGPTGISEQPKCGTAPHLATCWAPRRGRSGSGSTTDTFRRTAPAAAFCCRQQWKRRGRQLQYCTGHHAAAVRQLKSRCMHMLHRTFGLVPVGHALQPAVTLMAPGPCHWQASDAQPATEGREGQCNVDSSRTDCITTAFSLRTIEHARA